MGAPSNSRAEPKNGARIIDTPGIREFGLGPVTLDELKAAFPEFSGARCRFSDCTHKEEPGCAIREAGGTRYDAWLRLLELQGPVSSDYK